MRASRYLYLAAVAFTMRGIHARAGAPIYSFETLYDPPVGTNPPQPDPTNGTRPDAFHNNGGGTLVTQDTIGATDGTHSVKIAIVGGQFFSGALSEIIPPIINSAGSTGVALDITIPATGNFTGNFARMGLIEFGTYQGDSVQAQTDPQTGEDSIALAPGTYHIALPLIAAVNPITFDSNAPFSSIFGSDPNSQATPSSFYFYINKSQDSPLTVYLDNVTILSAVTHIRGDTNGDGVVDLNDYNNVINFFGTSETPFTSGDSTGDGTVDLNDYNDVINFFGTGGAAAAQLPPNAVAPSGVTVPEPASGTIFLAVAIGSMWRVRGRRRRGG
jgi:hypothetical protein